ncbi:Fic family protein [Methanoculleus sp. FWC-SCC1]|uniref:Fic family protein n=1 Tax=Methanoculleus frigidifontis TaxID=2584085 RepID=A0ABT8M7V3_9EURY|nr:Fic family protein [Methanoculleus sp. FWC-SCC1]MDN7024012.1 Fic family protein [Methanoculleus sp. FWC-SCC1]
MQESRSGDFVHQKDGYNAFIPKGLPPDPPIAYDETLQCLLSEADRALARLDGMSMTLPNPDLFIAMYMKKEALLSSQIEGTQASLKGVLEFEANLKPRDNINDLREVINYLRAMDDGLKQIKSTPISLNLVKDIHRILIKGTRGSDRQPGNFRTVQNYIAPSGATSISDAVFVPPPPQRVDDLMKDLEDFILSKDSTPPLIKIALIHAQFETIHPFLDGNGRMGRMLITFYLCWKGILARPLLYLSIYLKRHREEYYRILNNIRTDGEWEAWLTFFLRGVVEVSNESLASAKEVIRLKDDVVDTLLKNNIGGANAVKLVYALFDEPIITAPEAAKVLGVSGPAAYQLIKKLEDIGILKEITGKQRFRQYMFADYIAIIERGTRTGP